MMAEISWFVRQILQKETIVYTKIKWTINICHAPKVNFNYKRQPFFER
jgi:hypothetical protein